MESTFLGQPRWYFRAHTPFSFSFRQIFLVSYHSQVLHFLLWLQYKTKKFFGQFLCQFRVNLKKVAAVTHFLSIYKFLSPPIQSRFGYKKGILTIKKQRTNSNCCSQLGQACFSAPALVMARGQSRKSLSLPDKAAIIDKSANLDSVK